VCIIIVADLYTPLPPKIYWHIQENGDIGKQKEDESLTYASSSYRAAILLCVVVTLDNFL
jgi:hypothetical protein